jgi:FtsZ-binding cell division protein ZapB
MAKNKEEANTNSEGMGSKALTVIIIILIVFIWLAILALLIKFDVGGIGTNTFRPILKDIPIVNNILPDLSDEDIANENRYPYKNLNEAVDYIKLLEEKVDKLTEENDDYAERQAQMQTELNTLRHFADEYDDYLKQRELFDREIVYNEKAPEASE